MESPPANPSLDTQKSGKILLRCFRYLEPYSQLVGGAYLLLFAITGLALLIPQVVRWIVDQGIRGGDTDLLGIAALALLGLTLLKGVLAYWQGRWTEMASQGVAYDLATPSTRSSRASPFPTTTAPKRGSSSPALCRTWNASGS